MTTMAYLVDPQGRFVRDLHGTAAEILAQVPEGYTSTLLYPPRQTDYWNGTNWVAIGPAPAWYMQFNYETKQWEDTRDLGQVKEAKLKDIFLKRNQTEFGGFTYNDKVYDSDQIAQQRLTMAALGATMAADTDTLAWTTADDEVIVFNKAELLGLFQAMTVHIQSTHARAHVLRKAVADATTIAEVDSVLL